MAEIKKLFSTQFVQLSDAILYHQELTPAEKLVFAGIQRLSAKEGYAWPSKRTLAEWLNLSVNTVSRALKTLEAKGILSVARQSGNSNKYFIQWEMPLFHTQPSFKKNIPIQKLKPTATPPSNPDAPASHVAGQSTTNVLVPPLRTGFPNEYWEPTHPGALVVDNNGWDEPIEEEEEVIEGS